MPTVGKPDTAGARLPDFLGIGVVRGGTTWLWQNLRSHPDLWLTPVKEINYFNRLYPILRSEPETGRKPGAEKPNLLLEKIKDLRLSRWRRYLDHFSIGNLIWQYRFFAGQPSDRWYRTLFGPAGDRVTGDITPHYSALAEDAVRRVADYLPEAKVILLLRNPIARDWSHAVHWLTRYGRRSVAEVAEEEFIDHFHNPSVRLRGDYPRMLQTWRAVFPAERFFLGYFDDIVEKPDDLMLRLYRFLGVDAAEQHLPPGLRRRVNPSPRSAIPPQMGKFLAQLHQGNLQWLAGQLGGTAQKWLDDANEILDSDSRP